MTLQQTLVSDPADFAGAIRTGLQSGHPVFVLLSGTPNETGQSWCPDCRTADPLVRRELEQAVPEAVLIKCLVGDRTAWKTQSDNWWREHAQLRCMSIPSLYAWGPGEEEVRAVLVEDDVNDAALLAKFLTAYGRTSE